MRFNNFMKIEFPSVSSNGGFAREAVVNFVKQLAPTEEELENIRTAVDEAVDNAISHAYPKSLGLITIKCYILKGNIISITVKDGGVGIENVKRAKMPMFTTCSGRSGMGFTIMESFMTSLEIKSEVGNGTTVHMRKRITLDKKSNNT